MENNRDFVDVVVVTLASPYCLFCFVLLFYRWIAGAGQTATLFPRSETGNFARSEAQH